MTINPDGRWNRGDALFHAPLWLASHSKPAAFRPSGACRYRKECVVKLTDLSPRHMLEPDLGRSPWVDDPPRLYHEIAFLCPKCRKHEILVAFWGGEHRNAVQVGEAEYGPVIKRMWKREGTLGFLDLTLTPSINREGLGDKCGGWHGSITNGEVS